MSLNNTQLLLETLSGDLPDSTKLLLNDPALRDSALNYLTSLLNNNKNDDLLSTSLKPATLESNTLIEQVAELSNRSSILSNRIIKETHSNLSLVLDTNTTLENSYNTFNQLISLNEKLIETNDNTNWKIKQPHIKTSDEDLFTILKNIDKLLDFLELPSMTNAFVKAGQYSECIEISSLIKRLSIRYNDIELIKQVENNVNSEINDMLYGLIRLLNTELKQFSIIKIISYLKRITSDNIMLEKVFLKARYQFICDELNILKPLKESNLIEKYLKRYLEVIREHCLQTITTFESIFNKSPILIYSFIKSLVLQLCGVLKENLPLIKDQSIRDGLLLQLVYCSQSLSRVGGDFIIVVVNELDGAINRGELWGIVKKQKELIKSLNKT